MELLNENYNILENEWLPVIYHNGESKRISILQAILDSPAIRDIASSNSMDRFAIFRFMLALLYWCNGNPSENSIPILPEEIVPFNQKWCAELEKKKQYFNLFGDGHRFYQNTTKRTQSATQLIEEIPSGHNAWHFRHSIDYISGICLPCCVFGFLRTPLFSLSGLPSLKSGINSSPPIYIVKWGDFLFNTLMMNWAVHENLGKPSWEVDFTIGKAVVPLLGGLTVLPRKLKLYEPQEFGRCINCSTETKLVKVIEYDEKNIKDSTVGKDEKILWTDPHIVYKVKVNDKDQGGIRAKDQTNSKTIKVDRYIDPLIINMPLIAKNKLLIIGFVSDKAKKVDCWDRIINIDDFQSLKNELNSLLNAQNVAEKGMFLPQKTAKKLNKLIKIRYRDVKSHIYNIFTNKIYKPTTLPSIDHKVKDCLSSKAIASSISPGITTKSVKTQNEIISLIEKCF